MTTSSGSSYSEVVGLIDGFSGLQVNLSRSVAQFRLGLLIPWAFSRGQDKESVYSTGIRNPQRTASAGPVMEQMVSA